LVLGLLFWPSFKHDGLNAQTTTHGIGLTWTASPTTGATYNIYRGTVTGGPYATSVVKGLTVLTYEDTTVVTGSTYYYVATASAPGYGESVYSNEAHATFLLQASPPASLAATSN